MPTAKNRWIDLHLHSTASDGRYAPAKVMEMAAARGLSAVALTDHDSISGIPEACAAADSNGIEFINGVELEARHGKKRMHILGYLFDPTSVVLLKGLEQMVAQRHERNQQIVERLRGLDIDIEYDEVLTVAGAASVGRPHIASVLMKNGIVSGFQQAFSKYLGEDGATYVPRKSFEAAEAIQMVRSAGGVASLAHPGRIPCDSRLEWATLIGSLRDAGLSGLEVLHPDHHDSQTKMFQELARDYELCTTGGSDFHSLGTAVHRGAGFAKKRVPYEWLDRLRAARSN